jgi:calcium-dependent protein kinase
MEYCSGGELFDVVIKRRQFTDREAQTIMFQLLSSVSYFHDRNIIHRDLKPENILLEDSKEFFIKIADFGNSVIYQNRKLKGCFGSVYYIAPEVLANNYNQKCDVWSCGVIMYILLTGRPPFNGKTDDEIFRNIKIGTFNIEGDNLPILTDDAKDLIKKLLEKNPERRITAANALEHRWIKRMNREVQTSALNHAITSLQEFSSNAKLKTAVGTFIASQLVTHKEIKELKKVFQALDKNGDGRLSKEELMEGYKSTLGALDLEKKIIDVISKVDSDGNGFVDYTEFIQATLHNEILTSTKNLQAAFRAFDRDGSGRISASELRMLLSDGALSEEALWIDVIKEVDQNGDGEIDLKEFESLLMSKLDIKM